MKLTTKYVCNECGYDSSKWMGKCPACGAWNAFVEEKVSSKSSKSLNSEGAIEKNEVIELNKVVHNSTSRIKTGIDELDRVLGEGFVYGSLTLLGGEPGIGKSTLILQICDKIKIDGKILYVSGEEAAEQIKIRADSLFLSETNIDNVEIAIEKHSPKFVIIDSVQTMYSDEITSAARKRKSSKRDNIKSYENV